VLLFVSCAAVTSSFAAPKVSSPADLAVVEGRISSYSLLDDSKGIHQYTIHFSEYPAATFQIPSGFANYFARDRFESNVMKGDTLSVSISADNAGKLASGGLIPVFAARTKTATYLDEHYTLYAHDEELNSSAESAAVTSSTIPTTRSPINSPHSAALISIALPFCAIVFVSLVIGVSCFLRKFKSEPAPASGPDGAFISQSSQRLKQLAAKGKLNETEPNPAFTQCTLQQIPVVFEHLRQKGHDGSFVIFTFQPAAGSNPDDAISLQFSIASGRIGLDWCLNSPANIRDQDKLEGYIAKHGQRVRLMETNQVNYFRLEQGDLPLLCQGVIIELYAMPYDVKLDLAVQGFPWPPEPPFLTSAGGPAEHSQEPATA
jgi:hypothetical protein